MTEKQEKLFNDTLAKALEAHLGYFNKKEYLKKPPFVKTNEQQLQDAVNKLEEIYGNQTAAK